jgi:hypothetical protein
MSSKLRRQLGRLMIALLLASSGADLLNLRAPFVGLRLVGT